MSAYQPVGSLVGINHEVELSKSAYKTIFDNSISKKQAWSLLSIEQKNCFLAEEHEIAHHVLLSSTAAGMLEWRTAEVWHRDLEWLVHQIADLNLETPRNKNFVQWLESEDGYDLVQNALINENKSEAPRKLSYFKMMVEEIKNTVHVEDVLFGHNQDEKPAITRAEFCKVFNRWNTWASKRSGIAIGLQEFPSTEDFEDASHTIKIKSRTPNARLFSAESFNIHELIEAHATCKEVWTLHQHGDHEGASRLLDKRLRSTQANALIAVKTRTQSDRWSVGFSPSIAMTAIAQVLNARLDISFLKGQSEIYIEDLMPWLIIEGKEDLLKVDRDEIIHCIDDLERVAQQPIIQSHAKWIEFPKIVSTLDQYLIENGQAGIAQLLKGVNSHNVNRTLYSFHLAFRKTAEYLASQLAPNPSPAKDFSSWFNSLKEMLTLIEYLDSVVVLGDPPLFKSAEPFEDTIGVLADYRFVLAGTIFGSANYHIARAYWYGGPLPHPRVLFRKVSAILNDQAFDYIETMLVGFFDTKVRNIYKNTYLDLNPAPNLYCKQ